MELNLNHDEEMLKNPGSISSVPPDAVVCGAAFSRYKLSLSLLLVAATFLGFVFLTAASDTDVSQSHESIIANA